MEFTIHSWRSVSLYVFFFIVLEIIWFRNNQCCGGGSNKRHLKPNTHSHRYMCIILSICWLNWVKPWFWSPLSMALTLSTTKSHTHRKVCDIRSWFFCSILEWKNNNKNSILQQWQSRPISATTGSSSSNSKMNESLGCDKIQVSWSGAGASNKLMYTGVCVYACECMTKGRLSCGQLWHYFSSKL